MKPITLIFKPSSKLAALLILAGLFFSFMLILTPIPFSLSVTLLLLMLVSTSYFVMLDGLLSLPRSWKLLRVNMAGECHLKQKNDENFVVHIMPDSFVSAYLTVLHIVPEEYRWFKVWQNRYILLLQDNIDAESFRQLRVYLRWHKNSVNHHVDLSD
ncbi:protein YgfX [Methylotenera sp.]|uniref:protein YgfX n=1 Tax=Methylotenera sp. TaxID=2051956 RepID=UPI00345C4552